MKTHLAIKFFMFTLLFVTCAFARADEPAPNDQQPLELYNCVSALAPNLSGPHKASMAQTYCEAYGPEIMACAVKYKEWVMIFDGGIKKSVEYCQTYSRETLECAEKLAPDEYGYDKFRFALKDCAKRSP